MSRSRNSTRSDRHRRRPGKRDLAGNKCSCWHCMPILEKRVVLERKLWAKDERERRSADG